MVIMDFHSLKTYCRSIHGIHMLYDFTMVIGCMLWEAHSTHLSVAYPHFFAEHTIFFLHIIVHEQRYLIFIPQT